jgi:hypothetical protein
MGGHYGSNSFDGLPVPYNSSAPVMPTHGLPAGPGSSFSGSTTSSHPSFSSQASNYPESQASSSSADTSTSTSTTNNNNYDDPPTGPPPRQDQDHRMLYVLHSQRSAGNLMAADIGDEANHSADSYTFKPMRRDSEVGSTSSAASSSASSTGSAIGMYGSGQPYVPAHGHAGPSGRHYAAMGSPVLG